jgi:hypothetical protein
MWRMTKWILLGGLVLASAAGVYFGPRIYRLGNIGAGYIAKQMCSCVFVAERDFTACRFDMPPDMARVRAALLDGERGVRAWLPGIVERTARYTPGTGCTLY